jgi:hypothetical protein
MEATPWGAIAIVLATFFGPIVAVSISLWNQSRERHIARQVAVFTELMRWRRRRVSREFVTALNLVPVEFHDAPDVMAYFTTLMDIHSSPFWTSNDQGAIARMEQSSETTTAQLLSAMAARLGLKVDQLTILNAGYLPQGWVEEESAAVEMRDSMRMLLNHQRALAVIVYPTPPPPEDQAQARAQPPPARPEASPLSAPAKRPRGRRRRPPKRGRG